MQRYWLEEERNLYQLGDLPCKKLVSTRNSSILIMSSSEYLFLELEFSSTKMLVHGLYQIFVSTVAVFENEEVSDNTS